MLFFDFVGWDGMVLLDAGRDGNCTLHVVIQYFSVA